MFYLRTGVRAVNLTTKRKPYVSGTIQAETLLLSLLSLLWLRLSMAFGELASCSHCSDKLCESPRAICRDRSSVYLELN